MAISIDYYFTSVSPFTYIGHEAAAAVARKHGARLRPKAVNLAKMFEVSGQVPLAKRPPIRQNYRFIELQRAAAFRGRKINCKPKHFPVDPELADRVVTAVLLDGGTAFGLMERILAGVWAEDADIADEDTLAGYIEAEGLDSSTVLSRAREDETAQIRNRNTEEAIASNAIGVPSYVLAGEPFWGQDRIELLDHALASGRGPFRPL